MLTRFAAGCVRLALAFLVAQGSFLWGQDDPIDYTNPFGSDGLNNPRLTPLQHDSTALQEIWQDYLWARGEIQKPFPISKTENQRRSTTPSESSAKPIYYLR